MLQLNAVLLLTGAERGYHNIQNNYMDWCTHFGPGCKLPGHPAILHLMRWRAVAGALQMADSFSSSQSSLVPWLTCWVDSPRHSSRPSGFWILYHDTAVSVVLRPAPAYLARSFSQVSSSAATVNGKCALGHASTDAVQGMMQCNWYVPARLQGPRWRHAFQP